MIRKQIRPETGPKSVGPYSMGLQIDNTVYVSGQLPLDGTSSVVTNDIVKQTIQTIENIERVLEASGLSLGDVVQTTVYLTDFNDFDKMNQMYAIYFSYPYPARSCVEVSRLPKNAMISIDCVAVYRGESNFENDEDEECEGCCCD
ncbi:Rid family detoxifying hydrolase [Erysipelothrix tonsillarum]|uniref:Rid family detoxifying hydrolase n=1 Tax=Erysipelothrix tonsillarum TaxID=38402 RepID=UPI0003684001|nr:Rid family detoxifying hydrolase [Erysipelothrix tonsillarum]